jgi:hypothetical protein
MVLLHLLRWLRTSAVAVDGYIVIVAAFVTPRFDLIKQRAVVCDVCRLSIPAQRCPYHLTYPPCERPFAHLSGHFVRGGLSHIHRGRASRGRDRRCRVPLSQAWRGWRSYRWIISDGRICRRGRRPAAEPQARSFVLLCSPTPGAPAGILMIAHSRFVLVGAAYASAPGDQFYGSRDGTTVKRCFSRRKGSSRN